MPISEVAPTPPIEIPFVQPLQTGDELEALKAALAFRRIAGDNAATKASEDYLQRELGVPRVLLTPSGTAALELAAILADLREGDEVIMPSFTFSSTANAVVLRGAVPVFVDVRADTLNVDAEAIRPALTERTRAIMVVHYAGVPCDMEPIQAIADAHGLLVIEDAAQALHSAYRGRPAGALGDMAAFSFHETKNVHSGEGGAFACRSPEVGRRAEIVREKGTNRAAFFRGEIDKYTWIDVGSSFLPSELGAAFLSAQLKKSREITAQRMEIWQVYHEAFAALPETVLRPRIPPDCEHNAHIYHLRVGSVEQRTSLLSELRLVGIQCTSHYVPLHSSPAGRRFGRHVGSMENTDRAGGCLLRLPLWCGLSPAQVSRVIDEVRARLS